MVVSPCLHPRMITDKNGVKRSVPCGHCAACLVNKGLTRQQRYEDYLSPYPYLFFVTLTFNDDFLPIAKYDNSTCTLYHPCDCDYDGVVYSRDFGDASSQDCEYLFNCLKHYNGLPVLSHRHLINFKKRFRYQFYKLYKNEEKPKLFILSCGEYGPDATLCHRPHYHLCIATDKPIRTDVFEKCVRQAWSVCAKVGQEYIYTSFGFVNVQRCNNRGCVSYIAKYLNCTTSLPPILANSKWRPFVTSSTDVDGRLRLYAQSDVRKVISNPTYEVVRLFNGKCTNIPVPDSYKSRYFPRIARFSKFSVVSLYRCYGLYEFLFGKEEPYEAFKGYQRFTSQSVDGLPFNGYDFDSIYQDVEQCCFRDSDFKYIEDEFIQKRNFMKLYYISRRVCQYARYLGISHEKYVDQIIDYWNGFELDKLKRFYEYQEELLSDVLHPVSTADLFSLYYDTDENTSDIGYYRRSFGVPDGVQLSVDHLSVHRKYDSLMNGILKDSTKTKKRNDEFSKRGLSRKLFIPRFKHNIINFLNN